MPGSEQVGAVGENQAPCVTSAQGSMSVGRGRVSGRGQLAVGGV